MNPSSKATETFALVELKAGWMLISSGMTPRDYFIYRAMAGDNVLAAAMGRAYGEPASQPYLVIKQSDRQWHVAKKIGGNIYKILVTTPDRYAALRLYDHAIENKL
jgi:hypothetical protein